MAGEPGHVCRRGPRCAGDYQARISGPLLDRIDIRIEVPALAASDLIRPGAERDERRGGGARRRGARDPERALSRRSASKVRCNAQAGADVIETVAAPERAGMRLLEDAAQAMQLTARGYHRVLKLARTLADLDGAETVARIHIAEALAYRALPVELAHGGVSRRSRRARRRSSRRRNASLRYASVTRVGDRDSPDGEIDRRRAMSTSASPRLRFTAR